VNSVIIGHNRWGTVGGNSKATAHPFDVGDLVGAHNGTLTSKWRLKDANCFKTDSEAMLNSIQEIGVKETLKLSEGAWALVWYDFRDGSINFLRNKERSLYFVTDMDGCLFWASEEWMLSVSLSRHGIKHNKIHEVPVDSHIRSEISPTGALSKFIVVEAKAEKIIPQNTYAYSGKKVETDVKSPFPFAVSLESKGDNKYEGKRDVKLEIMGRRTDNSGASYLTCFDPEERSRVVRLYYFSKTDPVETWENQDIIANIGKLTKDKHTNQFFYKIVHSSVKPAGEIFIDQKYKDHKGNMLSAENWEKKYPSCAWCISPVTAGEENVLTTEGEVICPHCSKDHSVLEHIKIAH